MAFWDRLFQRKQPADARQGAGPAVYFMGGSWTQRPSWDMKQELEEGYESNSVVFACVDLISKVAAGIPWVIHSEVGDDKKEIVDPKHPLNQLLDRPNKFQGTSAFFSLWYQQYLCCGNSFLKGSPTGPPLELIALRPDRFEIIPNDTATDIKTYRYTVDNKKPMDFKPEEILHLKHGQVTKNDWFGLSPIRVGALLIDTDNESVNWNRNLMKNRGRPDALFNFPVGLTPQQRDEWKEWLETEYTGGRGAGKPLKIEGAEFTYTQLSGSPSEMDYVSSTSLINRRICQVYGVPPELIGDPQNKTYSNQQEARLALIEQVVFPFLDMVAAELNNWLVPRYGENLVLSYDKDGTEITQLKRKASFERVMTADWLSINEQREETGYDRLEEEEADVPRALLQQRALSSLAMFNGGGDTTDEEEEEPEEPEDDETPEDEPEEEEEEEGGKAYKVWNLVDEEQKVDAYLKLERQRIIFEQFFTAKIQKHFLKEKKAVAAAARKQGNTKDAVLAEVEKQSDGLAAVYREMYFTVGRFFFDRVRASVPKSKAWNGMETKATEEALAEMRRRFNADIPKRVELVTGTTKDKFTRLIEDLLLGGKSDEEVAEAIEQKYDEEFIPNRSQAIADTEVVKVSNYGSNQGAKATGRRFRKQWTSQRDGRVRNHHIVADSQYRQGIPIEENFIVNGEPLAFPGDDSLGASAGNIINCRCFMTYTDAQA